LHFDSLTSLSESFGSPRTFGRSQAAEKRVVFFAGDASLARFGLD